MKRITTTIQRIWLDKIVEGTKKREYREIKPYWTDRLIQPGGTTIPVPFELRMINGMKKDAPEVTVLIDKIDIGPQDSDGGNSPEDVYRLHIAKILNIKNVTAKANIWTGRKYVEVVGKVHQLMVNGEQPVYTTSSQGYNAPVRLLHAGRKWWLHYGPNHNTGAFKSRKEAEGWWTRGGR